MTRARPTPQSVEELYAEKSLKPEHNTERTHAWLQRRHKKVAAYIGADGVYRHGEHEWKVPLGLRDALQRPLNYTQMVHKYPWFVTWLSPKSGKRCRKYFMSAPHAIIWVAELAQYSDPQATVVSRHGYHAPTKLLGKFPRQWQGHYQYWCPRCMQPQRFRRTGEEFYAQRKAWNEDKGRYEFIERKLALLACTICGISNRDAKFRASNQPVEVRKFRSGVSRARRRRRR